MVDLSHIDKKHFTVIKIFRNNILPEQIGFFIRISLVLIQMFFPWAHKTCPSIHLSLLQGLAHFGKLFFCIASLLEMLTSLCTSSEICGKVCLGFKKSSLKSTFFLETFRFLQIWVHICFISQMKFCLQNASFFSKRTCPKEASPSRLLPTKGVN